MMIISDRLQPYSDLGLVLVLGWFGSPTKYSDHIVTIPIRSVSYTMQLNQFVDNFNIFFVDFVIFYQISE